MSAMAIDEFGRLQAMSVCIRALMDSHSNPDALVEALRTWRDNATAIIGMVHAENQAPAELAELSVSLDRFLFQLTNGLVGENWTPDS